MALDALNRLCKWRTVLAGWHNGTRSISAPGSQAMRDLMDKWLIMRAETNAVAGLMLAKGVFTSQEYHEALEAEAKQLDKDMEKFFDGFRSTDIGLEIIDIKRAQAMMARLGFPP